MVGEVLFVNVYQPEYGYDERQVAEQVGLVLAAQHEPRGEDGVMDDEDDEVGAICRHAMSTFSKLMCSSDIICELSTGTRMMAAHTIT